MSKRKIPFTRLSDAWSLLQPSRPAMLSTYNEDGSLNVAPFGWNMPISAHPPRVSVALVNCPPNRTLQNILREREFVLNVPTMSLVERMVASSYQHQRGVSKFSTLGFQPVESEVIRTPGIAECRASLECTLFKEVIAGDHTLILGDVQIAIFEDGDFDEDFELQAENAWPVIHLGQRKTTGGQIHTFLVPEGQYDVFVPYPSRDL